MASIRRAGRRRYEIRECRTTERGPRQSILASFKEVLTPEVLDSAERKARRPFDREALIARASSMDVPVTRQRKSQEGRALLAALNGGARLDPTLVGLLKDALEALPSEPLPEHLEDAAEWVGHSEAERSEALRGLLRVADLASRSRGPARSRPKATFPRFSSERAAASEG